MPNPGTKPVPTEIRERLARLATEWGETRLASELGMSRETLARAVAGFGVRRGSVAQIEVYLAGQEVSHG